MTFRAWLTAVRCAYDKMRARCALAIIAFASLVLASCMGAKSPSLDLKDPATMRAVLSASATAVLDADKLCAEVAGAMDIEAKQRNDLPTMKKALALAKTCESEYQAARESLMVGQAVLDIYETAHEGRIACAALSAFDAMKHIEALVSAVSVRPMPQSVGDAESTIQQLLAALVAPSCPVPVQPAVADSGADAPGEGG